MDKIVIWILNCLEICGVNNVIYKCYIICNLNLLYNLIVSSNSWVYTMGYPGGILLHVKMSWWNPFTRDNTYLFRLNAFAECIIVCL